MKYRCPYCGEKGFSTIEKLDFLPRFLPEYWQGARCSNCHQKAYYSCRWGGRIGRTIVVFSILLLSLIILKLLYPFFVEGPKWCFFAYILLVCVLLYGFNLLFGYFDKASEAEQRQDPVFRFTTGTTARLWPRVRAGEIYVLRFPKRGMHVDAPHIIGMVQKIEGGPDERTVTIRVVKEFLMEAPLPDAAVWLTTDGNLTLEGTVSQTYKLPPKEEE